VYTIKIIHKKTRSTELKSW